MIKERAASFVAGSESAMPPSTSGGRATSDGPQTQRAARQAEKAAAETMLDASTLKEILQEMTPSLRIRRAVEGKITRSSPSVAESPSTVRR